MWVLLRDKESEYVINLDNQKCFLKSTTCKQEECITFYDTDGADLTLIYETYDERESVYESLIKITGASKCV